MNRFCGHLRTKTLRLTVNHRVCILYEVISENEQNVFVNILLREHACYLIMWHIKSHMGTKSSAGRFTALEV